MSYARFGWDGSDVYVFMHVFGHLECCACVLSENPDYFSFKANSTQEMIDHLKEHQDAKHVVPRDVYDWLWEDDEENFGDKND